MKFCIFLLLLASEAHALTFINNVTVSSDILSEIFFEEIQNIRNDSSSFNESTSQNCLKSLFAIVDDFANPKVNTFFDSWGKIPSGINYGNMYDTGNFDQCVQTSVILNDFPDNLVGQYCFAKIPLSAAASLKKNNARLSRLPELLEINIGICIPDTCSPEFITNLLKNSSHSTTFTSGISVSSCTNGKVPAIRIINVIGMAFFSLIAALMVLSSFYDLFSRSNEGLRTPSLLAFSIATNGRKLFAINAKKSSNTIDCLTGIRVWSMITIIYFHTYLNASFVPSINEINNLPWSKTLWSMYIMNAGMAVDSFFFISGLLVAWTGFPKLDNTKGKLNIGMMYFHRYIRITPVLAATILFVMSVNELVYTGPFRDIVLSKNQCNSNTWWPNLLYIQNYYNPERLCNNWTWYLAADFQLYVLSPLLLIPLWKWGIKFSPVLLFLAFLSVGLVMASYVTGQFTSLLNVADENKWATSYIPTHARYPPWLVGLALGWYMHNNRGRIFRISKILQVIAWIVSFTILAATVFGPYFTTDGRGSVLGAAMFGGWKRLLWGVGLAWITFACYFGFGGVVNSFLSHPFWQPLGRLTFSMYLTNMIVLGMQFGSMRAPVYFSDYNEILYFCAAFGMTFVTAVVMALAFEYPVLVLENYVFKKKKGDRESKVELSVPRQ